MLPTPDDAEDPRILRERQRIGDRIRSLRLHQNLVQEDVATRAGIDVKTVSRIENAVTDPSIGQVIRIALALRVPLACLFVDDWSTSDESGEPPQ